MIYYMGTYKTSIETTTSKITKKGFKSLFFALLLLALPISNYAQKDTSFWFAAPGASSGLGDSPISLSIISYDNAADVTVSLPANGGFTPITVNVPANSFHSIDLSSFISDIASPSGNTINNNGIYINSTALISVNYELNSATNKEVFGLKGNNALGTEFYTPFQKNWPNTSTPSNVFSSFDIVASEDNTTVLITPRAAITGHAQDGTFSVVLNKGQTYSARDMNVSPSSSLAGSIVSADKPVAVTLFEDGLENSTCTDAIGEQMTNLDHLGTNFIVRKGTGSTDRIYIMSTENGTNLTFQNAVPPSASISWGETYEIPLTANVEYITSNKPVYVYHVSSMGCELSSSLVPNVYCAGDNSATVYRKATGDFGAILYTRSGNEGLFLVNGSSGIINASDFVPVPGTGGSLMVAEKIFTPSEVPASSLAQITNSGDIFGLAIMEGSAGSGYGYTYITQYESTPYVNAGSDANVCANVNFPLSGTVGGGPDAGSWSSSGYGTFTNGLNNLNNVYVPNSLDALISPVQIILTSDGTLCPSKKDTLYLTVNEPPLVNASVDQTVCENNAETELNGSIQGGSTTGTWTTLGSGTFSPHADTLDATYIPSATDKSNGNVTLVLSSTNNGNCSVEQDTIHITITPAPVVQIVDDTIAVCANNNTVSLNGSISGATTTGVWSTTGDGTFNPNNISLSPDYLPGVNDVTSQSNWIFLRSTSNGKCIYEEDSVFIQYTDAPSVDAGINDLICTNDSVISLNGSITGGATTGQWTGGNGTFSPSDSDLNASYTPTPAEISSGSFALTLTSTSNGNCNAENDVVQFMFVAPPYANFDTQNNCLEDSSKFVNFSLAGYGSITNNEWLFGDGNTSSDLNPSYIYGQEGQHDVQLVVTNSNGCTDTITKTIEVYPLPIADFNLNASCDNNQRLVSFTDASVSSDSINYWYYDIGGLTTVTVPDYDYAFNNPGNYIIEHIVRTTHGCSDTIQKPLLITPPPEAGFTFNFTSGTNVGTTYNFVDTSYYATSWHWELGNGEISTDPNPSTVYFDNGVFPVVQYVYDDLGCFDSTLVWITIDNVTKEISNLIPNMISPNGDGDNDIWKLPFIDLLYPKARVEVYNKWGQQIFESEGYQEPWDGRYKGKDVPDGNYYYVINLNAGGDDQIFKGALLVLRKAK